MMHTERKSPWIRGQVDPERPRDPNKSLRRGQTYDEAMEELAPKEDRPEGEGVLTEAQRQILDGIIGRGVGRIQQEAALGRDLDVFLGGVRTIGADLFRGIRGTAPGLDAEVNACQDAFTQLCATAETQRDLEAPEELGESYETTRDEYQEAMRRRGKVFESQGDVRERDEEGDRIGRFFAKQKLKRRKKKYAKQERRNQEARAQLNHQKDVIAQRVRATLAGPASALEAGITVLSDRLRARGGPCVGLAVITESVVQGVINTVFERLVPESGIRRFERDGPG